MKRLSSRIAVFAALAATCLMLSTSTAVGQGIIAPAAGPIHMSMGGASTSAAIDALGANFWNPAVISGMSRSEVEIGTQLAYPLVYTTSTFLGQGATTQSQNGLLMIPSLGLVYRSEMFPRLTIGAGTYALGAGVNYPGDPANPIFAPTGPAGNVVLGPSFSNMSVIQIVGNVSFQVTEKLAIGAGPVVDYCMVSFDPAFFALPDDASGDGRFTFPAATHSHPFWGGGFKAGVYYHVTSALDMGFGYTSPQWLETWLFNARDEVGNARQLSLKAVLPAVYSWGVAYKGIPGLTLATDLRFIDYLNATLFGTPVVAGGLGWQNTFAVAVGGQYDFGDRFSIRAGYVYNTNPIPSTATLFNIQAPGITQHTISGGFSLRLNDTIGASLAYAYNFPATLAGPVRELLGANVSMQTSIHSLLFGVTFKLGCPPKCDSCGPAEQVTPVGTAAPTAMSGAYAPGAGQLR